MHAQLFGFEFEKVEEFERMKFTDRFLWQSVLLSVAVLLTFSLSFSLASASMTETYAVNKPLTRPMLFAPGVVSTADDEFGGTFTPDGQSFYFVKRTQSTLRSNLMVICVSHYRDGQWTEPEIASFSGKYKDLDPFVSPDGAKLFFVSTRPRNANPKRDTDIWYVEKLATGWGEPKNVGAPVNSEASELSCSVTRDGTLYFVSNRKGGLGTGEL